MLNEKYAVLKRNEYEEIVGLLEASGRPDLANALADTQIRGDFFVIREHDVFGAQGLYAYAANIRSSMEFTEATGFSIVPDHVADSMDSLCETLVTTAQEWDDAKSKGTVASRIPD